LIKSCTYIVYVPGVSPEMELDEVYEVLMGPVTR
jgi:hypothetical protein